MTVKKHLLTEHAKLNDLFIDTYECILLFLEK